MLRRLLNLDFEGISSTDGDFHCWAVDKDTLMRLEGFKPDDIVTMEDLAHGFDEELLGQPKWEGFIEENDFHPGLYNFIPNYLATHKDGKPRKVRVRITIEEIE